MHVLALEAAENLIHPFWVAWIAALQWDNILTKILAKYSDYATIFSFKLAMELLRHPDMSEYAIELIEGKQLSYRPIILLAW